MAKKKQKETDYLHLSARLRAMEGRLLTRERRERMLDARSDEEAFKVLSECGWEELASPDIPSLEASLASSRDAAFTELRELAPDPTLVDIFRVKYDYHNAKALVKCASSGQDSASMLSRGGRYSPEALQEAIRSEEPGELSKTLWDALWEARDVLAATGDPQRSDFVLDRAYFAELLKMAEESGSAFALDYVRLQIDSANLRAALRTIRRGKGKELLDRVLVPGGTVDLESITVAVTSGASLEPVFSGPLQEAAALGDQISGGGSQTAFERACDNALVEYLQESRMIPFGEGVLISYLGALENDLSTVRIILSGRMAGVPTEAIRERMREAYV